MDFFDNRYVKKIIIYRSKKYVLRISGLSIIRVRILLLQLCHHAVTVVTDIDIINFDSFGFL